MITDEEITLRHVLVGTRPRRAVVAEIAKIECARDFDRVMERAEREFPGERLAVHRKGRELWIYPMKQPCRAETS
jgi:hypothetical protein